MERVGLAVRRERVGLAVRGRWEVGLAVRGGGGAGSEGGGVLLSSFRCFGFVCLSVRLRLSVFSHHTLCTGRWRDEHIVHHAMTNTADHDREERFADPQMWESVWAQHHRYFPLYNGWKVGYLIRMGRSQAFVRERAVWRKVSQTVRYLRP